MAVLIERLHKRWRTSRWMRDYYRPKNFRGNHPLQVIVVGSPRAGTSFLAGLVARMGYHLGPDDWLRQPDQNNPNGYFECVPLMRLSQRILQRLGGDFHNLPDFGDGWMEKVGADSAEIPQWITAGGIQLLKDNHLLILADLYHHHYPQAKWLYIERDINATYRSRFGQPLTFAQWQDLTSKRLALWEPSFPAQNALRLNFDTFRHNLEHNIQTIANHLAIKLTDEQWQSCLGFYKK